ncbi:hypothetical protein HKZ24_14695 [Listeria monocytogenes]|nr:hypothetical protein [Listeria monocytogenes]
MNEHREIFYKEMQNIRKFQTEAAELKNTITELKNTPEGFNSRLDEAEDNTLEHTQTEQQKEKRILKK